MGQVPPPSRTSVSSLSIPFHRRPTLDALATTPFLPSHWERHYINRGLATAWTTEQCLFYTGAWQEICLSPKALQSSRGTLHKLNPPYVEADHQPPSRAGSKNAWSWPLLPCMPLCCLQGPLLYLSNMEVTSMTRHLFTGAKCMPMKGRCLQQYLCYIPATPFRCRSRLRD